MWVEGKGPLDLRGQEIPSWKVLFHGIECGELLEMPQFCSDGYTLGKGYNIQLITLSFKVIFFSYAITPSHSVTKAVMPCYSSLSKYSSIAHDITDYYSVKTSYSVSHAY